jgi:hypothetical protein
MKEYPYKTILVRYRPDGVLGTRWLVTSSDYPRLTVFRDYGLDHNDDARRAAGEFIKEHHLKWTLGSGGILPDGDYVFLLGR